MEQELAGTSKDASATAAAVNPITATSADAMTSMTSAKRKKRLSVVPNLVKRRPPTALAKLRAEVEKCQAAEAEKDKEENEIGYMSEAGEGHYTGDSNAFAELATSDFDDEEEAEAQVRSKLIKYEDEMALLRQKMAPLTDALKKMTEARKIKEALVRQELKSKKQQQEHKQQQQPSSVQTVQQKKQQIKQQTQSQPKAKLQSQEKTQSQSKENIKTQGRSQTQERSQKKADTGATINMQQSASKKKEKVPPINVVHIELEETIQLCKAAIGESFSIKRINNKKHAIHCLTVDGYNKIKMLLKEATTEFFTFTPKVEKIQTVLLKGIDSCTEPQALLSELRRKANDDLDFIGVKPFQTVRAKREMRKLPIFLVQLSPKSKLDSLRKITILNYQVVTWDKLRRRDDMLQCMRCQRFGHAAANCEMQSRCVKCGENHIQGECKLGREPVADRAQLKCVLCGNIGHPANYRGCPKFQQIKSNKIARQIIEQKRPTGRAPTTNLVNPKISYSQMVSGMGSTAQPTPKVVKQAPVPKTPAVEADILAVLLSIQGQLTGLQSQIREQTERVDHLYSFLPSLTQLRS